MPERPGDESITVLAVPQPVVRPMIASTTAVIFLSLFAILPWKLGIERFLASLAYFSATWLVILMFAPPIAFFYLACIPTSGLSASARSHTTFHSYCPGSNSAILR